MMIINIKSIQRLLYLAFFFFTTSIAFANDFVFTPINVSQGLSDNQVRYILQLADGRMVFTTSGNLNIYDGSKFSYIHRTSDHIYPIKKYDGFYRIYHDQDSLLWIKDHHKLMCVNLRKEKYLLNLESYFKAKGLKEPVQNFFMDSQKKMWVQTSRGLLDLNTLSSIDLSINKGDLQDVDADGDLLYLFYNTGEVVCYNTITKKRLYGLAAYPKVEQKFFKRTSLIVKGKSGFYQIRNGDKSGCFFFDVKKQKWKTLLVSKNVLNTLTLTPEETIYISTSRGFYNVNPKTGENQYIPSLKTKDGNLIDTEISSIFYDFQGGLWVGTLNRGLLYYHPSRYQLKQVGRSLFLPSTSKEISVQAFAEDYSGRIYVKTGSNFYLYASEINKELIPVKQNSLPNEVLTKFKKKTATTFKDNVYTSVCKDSRGWIWAGTPDGLMLFTSEKENASKIFYTEDGLINNFVHALLEDKNHNIWVTTSYGISKITVDDVVKQKVHFTNYNIYNGTLEGEYVNSSIYESSKGELYFGGIDGFNVLNPTKSSESKDLFFKPAFTSFYLRGEEVKIGAQYDGEIILSQSTNYTQKIELLYNQNFLTFEFSALNYLNKEKTYYRYYLQGIDDDWNQVLAGRNENGLTKNGVLKVSYTNLSAGKYMLKVMASENPKVWKGEATKVLIVIHAPWWKTTTAYIVYVFCFLIILIGGIYMYVKITKKKIEREHNEEMLLLRVKNLIDQLSHYERESIVDVEKSKEEELDNYKDKNELPKSVDTEFITHAIETVENNLDTPGYSVEQLSKDLCMDRTGLYRKLTDMLDESPSLFIRNIRLQRAAKLLLENNMSITEIAEKVGFSTTSYMSKCFQDMYGCKPSEYAKKLKKST